MGIEDTALLQTLARIGAQAFERSRLFDDEQRLRRRTDRVQLTTAALSGALTQRDVAEVVVDALVQGTGADGAAFSVVMEDRNVQKKLAWRGYESEAQENWLEIPLDAATPGNRALATRSLVFYARLEDLAADYPQAAHRMVVTGHESFLFLPLVSGGRTNGLVVTSFADPVALDDEDLAFMETLASQAAQALDRARSFESERTIAETLQRSVLPVSLPRIPSVQLAARYLPGTEEVDVGGDWFDAILLPTGRLGLAVGDVVGKGVQAAATMAQLRNALRAFALDQMKPSSTLSRLNRLTEELSESAFATVLYAVLDPETGVCRFTSAGHPPPLVVLPDGRASYVEGGRGLPLGTGTNVRYRQETLTLPVGSTLVFYTDGLVERRTEPIDAGLERLRRAVEEAPGDPERFVEHVLETVVGSGGRRDDIAVLAVRLLAVAPKPLELDLPSDDALARPRPGRAPGLAGAGTGDGDRVPRDRARYLGSLRECRRAPAGRDRPGVVRDPRRNRGLDGARDGLRSGELAGRVGAPGPRPRAPPHPLGHVLRRDRFGRGRDARSPGEAPHGSARPGGIASVQRSQISRMMMMMSASKPPPMYISDLLSLARRSE